MTAENETKNTRHWPTILLGIIVAAIFLVAIFSFQVNTTETAVVTTLDKIDEADVGPGLHFRWPYPIQKIYKFDKRLRCFSGTIGKLEETLTSKGQNVIIGIFIIYQINDAKEFFRELVTVPKAERQLNEWMRNIKNETFGEYGFHQLINTDPGKMQLQEIENKMRTKLAAIAGQFGIKINSVGINVINIPESISKDVFDRMINERTVLATQYRSEGEREAKEIRIAADAYRQRVLTDANAKAKSIRAEGDAKAAEYYSTFKKNPELAIFLRKLDALSNIMKTKTTLILDTNSVPFDMLKLNASQLQVGPLKDSAKK
jgi:membrane protease subunit HflC